MDKKSKKKFFLNKIHINKNRRLKNYSKKKRNRKNLKKMNNYLVGGNKEPKSLGKQQVVLARVIKGGSRNFLKDLNNKRNYPILNLIDLMETLYKNAVRTFYEDIMYTYYKNTIKRL